MRARWPSGSVTRCWCVRATSDDASLAEYFDRAIRASPEHPVLLDRFLEDAFEADVDAIADGERVFIGGVMQHIEEAGVHSGDSACVVPPYLLRDEDIERMRRHTRELAEALDVRGLINVQYAVFEDDVYVLEVNPRASRTVPFISKAIGVPLARVAARVLAGRRLDDLNLPDRPVLLDMAVKEAVLPFDKFPEADPQLGPEMRSTGEVMGIADSFGLAFAKAQLSAGSSLPISGTLAITVHDRDKPNVTPIARRFHELGFEVRATEGTADYLGARGIPCGAALKLHEGRPNLLDLLLSGDLQLLINTPLGKHAQHDDYEIRRAAVARGVPYTTTLSAASAAADAITALRSRALSVCSLQDRENGCRRKAKSAGTAFYLYSCTTRATATCEENSTMDESTFNLEVRKFLKTFGVNAQREIEKAVRARILAGDLSGEEMLEARITLDLPDADLLYEQEGTIALS